MNCTTYWYNVFQSVASFMPVSVHATRSMLLVFILWFFPWAEMQFVQAGPLADAVEKAKVAAGVTREIPVPELDVQEKGVRPALPPTAGSEPPQRVEVSTASVAVRLPITGGRDTAIRAAILRQLDRLQGTPGRRGQLVLQFDATSDEYASNSDFGRSLELARFLTDARMANVKTIAYLPDGAQGHAVLVALACEEIVMSPDALLGPVAPNKKRADDTVRAAYKDIAGRRRTVPPPLALALVDPSLRVVRVITEVGDQIVLSERVPDLREEVQVFQVEDIGARPLVLSGRRCREIGVVQLLVKGTTDLARSLDIDPERLVLDPSMERGWKAAVVSLSGPISSDSVARVRVRLEEAITSKANFLCLKIDSAGGSPEQSLVLARWLREINPAEVKTVAYIPNQARSDAALIALACDDVVMNETAVLGGEGAATIDARQADAIEAAWQK
ncbi:MAG: hypothetical protein KAT44_10270, partial [Pirellulales bacterium]|nr:hypothetical protein [Pirellulales bacterium]